MCRGRERSGSRAGTRRFPGSPGPFPAGAGGVPKLQPVASAVLAPAAPPSEERSPRPALLALRRLSGAGNHSAVSLGQDRSSLSSPSSPVLVPQTQTRGPAEASCPPAPQRQGSLQAPGCPGRAPQGARLEERSPSQGRAGGMRWKLDAFSLLKKTHFNWATGVLSQ